MRDANRANRSNNRPTPMQVSAYNYGNLVEEYERLKRHNEHLFGEFEQMSVEMESLSRKAEEANALVHQVHEEKRGLLQRLADAISSRNSMRGRLANMTAQRNRALQEQKTAMDKLTAAYQQIGTLQQDYDDDMSELANAYKNMTPDQRRALPPQLMQLLDQIEQDYED